MTQLVTEKGRDEGHRGREEWKWFLKLPELLPNHIATYLPEKMLKAKTCISPYWATGWVSEEGKQYTEQNKNSKKRVTI